MSIQFIETVCTECKMTFRTSNGSSLCYECALKSITHGLPPEEGDFNTAKITSGTMTAQERKWLQEDLASVECADPDESDEEPYEDWSVDDINDTPDGEEDPLLKFDDVEQGPLFIIYAECPEGWYDFDVGVPENEVASRKSDLRAVHSEKCGCQSGIIFQLTDR